MPFDAETFDLAAETDAVIRAYGVSLTPNHLYGLAEEISRQLRFYPAGPIRAEQVVRELQRRARASAGR